MKKKRKQSRKRKWSRIEILMLLTFLSTVAYQILDLVENSKFDSTIFH